jgi:transposase-like protein
MPKQSKHIDVVRLSLRSKKLCPHCGHDEFRAVESPKKILGIFRGSQEFICLKCNGTFKKANLVRVHQKEKHYSARKISKSKHIKH